MFERILPEEFSTDHLIDFLEKDRFTVTTAFIYLIVLGVLRSVAESLIFQYPVFSLYLVAQHTAFNFPVLILGVLVIKLATDAPLRKVFNVVLLGFWIVVLPPYIDYFFFGLSGNELSYLYGYYAEGLTFIDKLAYISPTHTLLNQGLSPGLRIMLFSIVALSTVYIAAKMRVVEAIRSISEKGFTPLIRKASTVIFGCIGIWVVIYFVNSSVPSVISLKQEGIVFLDYFDFKPYNKYYHFISNYPYDPMTEIFPENYGHSDRVGLAAGLVMQQRSLFITIYFFFLSLISMILTLWTSCKDILRKIISSLSFPILLATTASTISGSAVLHLVDSDYSEGLALDFTYILHMPYITSIFIIGISLGFFCSFTWNHYKDEADIPKWITKNMAIVSLICGGSFAFLMGPLKTFSIYLITALIMFVTFRSNESVLDGTRSSLFSIGCITSSLTGLLAPGIWKIRTWEISDGKPIPDTYSVINLSRLPDPTGEVVGILLVIGLGTIILSFVANLLYQDKFPTELPLSLILIPVFFLPALLVQGAGSLFIFGAIGFNTSIFLDKRLPLLPLSAFSIEIFYISLRFWGLIPALI